MKRYTLVFGSLLFTTITPCTAAVPGLTGRIPALVTVRAADARASENTNDTGAFVVRRGFNTLSPLVVFYRLSGTASNGVDYDELIQSVQFAPGQSAATVVVKPIDDFKMEPRETVTLRIVTPPSSGRDGSYRIGAARSATITIGDNDLILVPTAAATVSRWPELGISDEVREGTLQSAYFRTSAENREFRRTFLEFEAPAIPETIVRATLRITYSSEIIGPPVPSDIHELSAYPADLAVTPGDYAQSTADITTFETAHDGQLRTLALDVTETVRMLDGQNLGFRIKLAVDPVYSALGRAGVGFQQVSLLIESPRN